MGDRKYYIGCPICGATHTKVAVGSDCDVQCSKCKRTVMVTFLESGHINVRYDAKL